MSEKDYAKLIARNLRKIMFEAGKTQADVSRDLGISKATISSWMNGTRIPRMDKIDMLCNYFNVTRAAIMEEHDSVQERTAYYLNPETAQIAQRLFERPEARILFDAAEDCTPEDLLLAADLLRRLKGTNKDG